MYICKDSVFDLVCDLCRYCIHGRMSLINRKLPLRCYSYSASLHTHDALSRYASVRINVHL